jgi:hypothetical protein
VPPPGLDEQVLSGPLSRAVRVGRAAVASRLVAASNMPPTSPSPLLAGHLALRNVGARRLDATLRCAAWLCLITALASVPLYPPWLPPLPLLGHSAGAMLVLVCSGGWLFVDAGSALLVLGLTLVWSVMPWGPLGPGHGVLRGWVVPLLCLVATLLGSRAVRFYHQTGALQARRATAGHDVLDAVRGLLWGAFSACRTELSLAGGSRARNARLDDAAWAQLRCVRGARWQNWAKTVECRPQIACTPASIEDLASIVTECAAHGRRLRVVGGGFSWTSFCASDEVLVFCAGLDGVEVDLSDRDRPTVWAECGATNRQINEALRRHGLELPYNVVLETVRVGGITSMGTHGSGKETATLGDLVEAFEVIDATGERRLLSNETIGAEAMSAARLSFGLFGVIARVRLRADRAAAVLVRDEIVPIGEAIDRLATLIQREESAELLWFPFSRTACLHSYSRIEGRPPPAGSGLIKGFSDLLQMGLLNVLHGYVMPLVPRLTPKLLGTYNLLMPTGERVARRSEAIHYRKWLEVIRASCVEVGFKVDADFANVHAAFNAALRIIEDFAARGSFPIDINLNIRFTGPSGALLSAAYGPGLTCYIEVLGMGRPADWEACSGAILSEWLRFPGALPHWAKEFEHVPGILPVLRERLGDRLARFRHALDGCGLDPTGMFRNDLVSRLCFFEETPHDPALRG